MKTVKFKDIRHLINSRYITLTIYDGTSFVQQLEFNVMSEAYDEWEAYSIGICLGRVEISIKKASKED